MLLPSPRGATPHASASSSTSIRPRPRGRHLPRPALVREVVAVVGDLHPDPPLARIPGDLGDEQGVGVGVDQDVRQHLGEQQDRRVPLLLHRPVVQQVAQVLPGGERRPARRASDFCDRQHGCAAHRRPGHGARRSRSPRPAGTAAAARCRPPGGRRAARWCGARRARARPGPARRPSSSRPPVCSSRITRSRCQPLCRSWPPVSTRPSVHSIRVSPGSRASRVV